jgi:hypothetical protein
MNILHWIPWKPEKIPSSFTVLCHTPYGITPVIAVPTATVIYI